MHNKRQAVWLVTMFSLMVGFSVFYVMTDPINPWDGVDRWVSKSLVSGDSGIEVNALKTNGPMASPEPSPSSKSAQMFQTMHEQKQLEISKKTDSYLNVINDTHTDSETMNDAYQAVSKLEDLDEKMTDIEEKLSQTYHDAVLLEEQDQYRVMVQSKGLTNHQATSIMKMVTNELHVGPDQVMVQAIP